MIALEWKVNYNGLELAVMKEKWGGNEILGQGFERWRLTFRQHALQGLRPLTLRVDKEI